MLPDWLEQQEQWQRRQYQPHHEPEVVDVADPFIAAAATIASRNRAGAQHQHFRPARPRTIQV
jgi:hypothetical protein